jgi:hypothetical protein
MALEIIQDDKLVICMKQHASLFSGRRGFYTKLWGRLYLSKSPWQSYLVAVTHIFLELLVYQEM